MNISHGGIGEVVNTPDCGSGMRGFDPHISPHFKNDGTMYRFFVSNVNVNMKCHKNFIIKMS